jgi:outer membrane protein assembly factor BamB
VELHDHAVVAYEVILEWLLSHGGIVVTTFAGKVMAFSEAGILLWNTELPAVVSSLVEVGGRLVLNGLDRHLYGLDSQSGDLLWNTPLHETFAVPLDRQQEAVMLVLDDGRLIELDIQTGKQHELAQVTGNPVTAPYIQGNSIIVFIKSFGSPQGVILKHSTNDNPKMEI